MVGVSIPYSIRIRGNGSGNYLFNNKLRGALSNSNEENNTKSFELEMIFAIGIEYHFLEVEKMKGILQKNK